MQSTQKIPHIIDFMGHWWIYAIISGSIIIPGTFYLIKYGLKPSIDFTGGTILEVSLPETATVSAELIQMSAPQDIQVSTVQNTGPNTYLVRSKTTTKDQNEAYKIKIASASGNLDKNLIKELRYETVGPVLGAELLNKTYYAVILTAIAIMLYLAYQFKNIKYGVSAIISMFHDSLVLLSVFAILGHHLGIEVDTLFVTAMLTTLSFSVHDTVVVYNRIRESQRKFPSVSYLTIVNKSITETLARSINNSMTIIFMLLALVLFGGDTIRYFVLALLVGTITGTYSSPFVAGPLIIAWDRVFDKKR
jgi:preprotein translocase subunit SecF